MLQGTKRTHDEACYAAGAFALTPNVRPQAGGPIEAILAL